jgi:hypothetical protein
MQEFEICLAEDEVAYPGHLAQGRPCRIRPTELNRILHRSNFFSVFFAFLHSSKYFVSNGAGVP